MDKRRAGSSARSRAVVLGGGIAGLSAAAALAPSFDEVVVVERDEKQGSGTPRPGAPQGAHAHLLLDRGRRELEALFPSFTEAMLEGGAAWFDPGVGLETHGIWGLAPRGETGVEALGATRDLVEKVATTLLHKTSPTVIRLTGRKAVRLEVEDHSLQGVWLQRSHGDDPPCFLAAKVVVDAMGRRSKLPALLLSAGYRPPPVQEVDAKAGYASRFVALQESPLENGTQGVWVSAGGGSARGALLAPVEDGKWVVTAAGLNGDVPPIDEDGFAEFLRSLGIGTLNRALRTATALSPIRGYRAMTNRYRRYDRVRVPAGLFAVGDAVCAFNPVYGQGMSAAVAAVALLKRHLTDAGFAPGARPYDKLTTSLSHRYFRLQRRLLEQPWRAATLADLHWPAAKRSRFWGYGLVSRVPLAILKAVHLDPVCRRQASGVFHLVDPPSRLLAPAFVKAVTTFYGRRATYVSPANAPPSATAHID